MNAESLINAIKKSKKHKLIYHFTDNSNLSTIRSHGLLSKEKQPGNLIFPPKPGGDNISRMSDKLRGINNDVSLCLTRNHPMAYRCRQDGRHPNQVYLGLAPETLLLPGVRVALGMANAHDTRILPLEEGIQHIDTEIIYNWVDAPGDFFTRMSKAEKVEVLVPDGVPRAYIKKIFTS